MTIKKWVPLLDWLSRYKLRDLRLDMMAGITVSVIAVPQVMAYAQLAGLPPVYGLYASITPLIVYALFGTSPQLSVGPTAVSALLVLTGIGSLEGVEPGTGLFVTMALAATFLSGVIQLLFGIFRLGMLVNFLSRPVIYGFSSAAAVLIFFSQLKYLLGVQVPRSSGAYEMVVSLAPHVREANGPTLLLGLISLLALLAFRRWLPRWPGALLVMIATTAVVYYGGFAEKGIEVVGDIQRGLPHFQWPFAKEVSLVLLMPTALTIALMSFVESLAISKTIESRHNYYRLEPNQELVALGLSKILSAFFQAFPTSGSFSRSAINDFAGARTGVASIISAVLIGLVLLYLTPIMYYLPQAVLAAVITVAVYSLLEWKQALYLWQTERRDFMALIATFLLTLFLGVQSGVLAGVAVSLGLMIYHNARPHLAVLGRLPGTRHYRNVGRFAKAEQQADMLIVRFDAQLYFGNAEYFRESIEALVKEAECPLKLLILDASSIHDMDATGAHELRRLLLLLKDQKIKFFITGVIGPVRDALSRHGLTMLIGLQCQFFSIHDAVACYQSQANDAGWSEQAVQTNEE